MASRLKRRSSVHMHLARNNSLNGAGGHGHHLLNQVGGEHSSNESFDDPMGADNLEPEEEERERKARRGLHKRQSMGGVGHANSIMSVEGTPVGGAAAAAALPQTAYSAAQLTEIYDNCIRLSAENKINIKNAFQLKMIDYMAEMMKKKKSELDNFQAASCALDASTKIYAYRVDSVHTDTLKLASGVGSNKADKEDGGVNGDAEGGFEDGDGDEGKKKRKKRKRATMVEKNLNNINCSKFDLEFDVDPLFKKVSAQFDSGGGGGQFLSSLRMKDDSCQLLLDSNALVGSAAVPPPTTDQDDEVLEFDQSHVPTIRDKDHLLCPTFAEFSFCDWSLEREEAMQSSQENSGNVENKNINGLAENEEHVFDPDAVPPEDHGDEGGMFAGDDFEGDGDDDAGVVAEGGFGPGGKNSVTMALMDVKTLRDHLASVPSEYSYFDSGRIGAWAGPKHWKFKPFHRAPAATSDKKKKARKEKEKLDFDDMDNVDKNVADLVTKAMTVPQKAIKLQNRTMESWNEEKNVLPEDMHYSGNDFVKLEGMAKSNVAPKSQAESQSVDDTVEDYDFDNPNDTNNFCPSLEADDNYPADGTGAEFPTMDSQSALAAATTTGGEEGDETGLGLISAPNRVEKIQIGYAKLAKKIDMRKLKTVEWSILNDSARVQDKENSMDSVNKTSGDEEDQAQSNVTLLEQKGYKFKDMYSSLLGAPSPLPSKMKENLSVPLAFVALLHLCNEQVLELKSEGEDFRDLIIRKA